MPIPAGPDQSSIALAITALFRQLHDQLREELTGLGDDDVNWAPAPGTNSIATIVVHTLGSEMETLEVVAGLGSDRNRDTEFAVSHRTTRDLLDMLTAADARLDAVAPLLADDTRLWDEASLPTLPADERRPAITWLAGNYGHAREHVGHIQLTKQLRRGSKPVSSP